MSQFTSLYKLHCYNFTLASLNVAPPPEIKRGGVDRPAPVKPTLGAKHKPRWVLLPGLPNASPFKQGRAHFDFIQGYPCKV